MKQFKQLGWIKQALLGLVLLSAMSHSDAMSVRERYLQQHPAAKAEQSHEKESSHHQKHHHSEKHAVKAQEKKPSKHHRNAEHSKHHQIEQPKHHHVDQPIKKHVHSHKAKEHHERVVAPKLAPSKFDSQQARDAEEALHHQPVKHEVSVKRAHAHHVARAPIKHHAAHHETHHPVKTAHHHRHHHAE